MTRRLGLLTGGVLLVALLALLLYVGRSLVMPLNRLAEGARRVGDGDLSVRVGDDRRDELGEVTRAFDRMTETVADQMASLEDRVEARTRELREARDRATQADAAKTRFLSTMNHELRSPLNAILGYADLIRAKTFGDNADAYAGYAETIHQSGQHLLDLVNDVLAMAKLEHGSYTLSESWLDVDEVAGLCLKMTRPQADAHGVTLHAGMETATPLLYGDERALRQMILNLLSNAVKFAGDGGWVKLSVARDADGGLAVAVTDTGPGIAPDDQERILKPFEQAPTQGSGEREPGTGLGLAITSRLAGLHDGHLTIDSTPGEGSTFTIVFPPARVAPPEPAA